MRDGTFGKGNTFGRGGNPYLRRIHALKSKFLDCTTEADIEQLVATLRELSAKGDIAAMRLWIETVLGKPAQALALTGFDGGPLGGDLATLQTVIMAALSRHPAARVEVAAALMRLRCDDGRSDDAGDRS
jgi:hypothetical protein